MGGALSNLKTSLGGCPALVRIVFAGLHQAGKTTALLSWLGLPIHRAVPTLGFECEEVKSGGRTLQVWDLQGEPARGLPRDHYYTDMAAIVFFVDSAQPERFSDSADALRELLASPRLPRNAVLLVLANKQDKPDARSVQDVQQALGLDAVSERTWHIAGCSATDGDSVKGAMAWLDSQPLT